LQDKEVEQKNIGENMDSVDAVDSVRIPTPPLIHVAGDNSSRHQWGAAVLLAMMEPKAKKMW
jgi:hypothetical protein